MKRQQKRWTAARASTVLDRADRAKSDNAYAVAQGLNGQRLAWWRKRLGRPRGIGTVEGTNAKVAFVEVTAKQRAPSTMVEVLLSNGRQVRVSDEVEPAVLGRIADALDRGC